MDEAMKYPVNDLYLAIQGEGALAGTPMALLRLHGCGVGCPWCDTKETWVVDQLNQVLTLNEALGATSMFCVMSPNRIAKEIDDLVNNPDGDGFGIEWVLVTGGEPANQDLQPLVDALHGKGFKVAIETSGTADGAVFSGADWITVSPKIDMPGGLPILPEALLSAHEIKHVVGKQHDIDVLTDLLEDLMVDTDKVTISLQPVSQSDKATQLCVKHCMLTGWRLSLQLHKYIGGR